MPAKVVGRTLTPAPLPMGEGFTPQAIRVFIGRQLNAGMDDGDALSGNTDPLGTLSTSAVTTSGTPRTATINTNAKSGWTVWAKDSNTGLNSPTVASTIASTTPGTNSTLTAGVSGYNTGITQTQAGGAGTITVAAPFIGAAAGQGGGLDTSLRALASSNGTADTAVLTIKNNVAISPTVPAASDYTDTITIIGAGLF